MWADLNGTETHSIQSNITQTLETSLTQNDLLTEAKAATSVRG